MSTRTAIRWLAAIPLVILGGGTRAVTPAGDVIIYVRNYSFYTANLDTGIGDADVIYGGRTP
jgi:hypothetical protein